jgi:hypothetical protein
VRQALLPLCRRFIRAYRAASLVRLVSRITFALC